MFETFDNIFNFFSLFDLIYVIITLLAVIQCLGKGFILSLLSSSKWILALVITVVAVPKLRPWAGNYIESRYAVDITLGIAIFLIAIFIILLTSRGISKVVKYSGLGGLDSFFGFLFGFLKGYIISIILFSLVNWFYSYEKWDMSLNKSLSFPIVEKGSKLLIEEFPSRNKIEETKEEIENI